LSIQCACLLAGLIEVSQWRSQYWLHQSLSLIRHRRHIDWSIDR
jgi:hypothetical protein